MSSKQKNFFGIVVIGSGLSSLSFINSYLGKKGSKKIDVISPEFNETFDKNNNLHSHIYKYLPPQMLNKLKNVKRLGHEKYVLPLAHISIGKYIIHIENWLKYFPMEQFLFLTTDEINSNLNLALKKIYEFLQIPERNIPNLKRQNVGKYPKMDNYTRLKLIEYYKPYNKKLEELLNRELNWDK